MKKYLRRLYGDLPTFGLDMLCNLAGASLYAAGVMLFAKASGFALGGLSGVSLLVNYLSHLPVGAITLALNIPLILFSWRILGKAFLVRSAVSILFMTSITDLVVPHLPVYQGDPLLAALFGGALLGAGLGVIYSRGSSTGGTDFLVLPLHRLLPRFTLPQLSISVDAVIILLGGLVYRKVDAMLYGVVMSTVSSIIMDRVMNGSRSEKLAIIITNDGMGLAKRIAEDVDRGSTNIKAIGTYTGQERDVLLCVCSRQQVVTLRKVVHRADPGALVTISEVTEAYGTGFQSPDKQSL